MTLCVIWKDNTTIHLASDSRLSFGSTGNADIAIKVSREPYSIRGPDGPNGAVGKILAFGDLAFCFAGSGLGAVFMKDSLSGVLSQLQVVPGWHGFALRNVAGLVFETYLAISNKLMAVLQEKAFVSLVIAGYCAETSSYRAFLCEPHIGRTNTDGRQAFGMREILNEGSDHLFIGSGNGEADAAVTALGSRPTSLDFMRILKTVIDNPQINGVGGSIQYGRFNRDSFSTFGIIEISQGDDYDPAGVHYWRGALDLREASFENRFSISYPLISLSNFYP